jgi:RNA polymerase sigma-70 factor (ECF subfamily)
MPLTPPECPDAALATAFLQATWPHRRGVYHYALRLTANPADADDLVQDTYLRAWQAWPPHCPLDLRPWLYRICRNRFLSLHRDRRRDPRHVLPPPPPLHTWDPAAVWGLRAPLSPPLAQALAALPAPERRTFLAHVVADRDYATLAAQEHRGAQVLRVRVCRARARLRTALAAGGVR